MPKTPSPIEIFYLIVDLVLLTTKKKFKLRRSQFKWSILMHNSGHSSREIEGLKFLVKSQQYFFEKSGVLWIFISYQGVKKEYICPFILCKKNGGDYFFISELFPTPSKIGKSKKKRIPADIVMSIGRDSMSGLNQYFKRIGMRMHLCSTKVPVPTLHYYIVPLV